MIQVNRIYLIFNRLVTKKFLVDTSVVDVKSGSPTKVLMKDRFVQLCIIGWILTFILILYC